MTTLQPFRPVGGPDPDDADDPARPGRLVLDTSHSVLCPQLARRRVEVTVDDLPLRLPWGRTAIDLPAGRHVVEIQVEDDWGRVVDAVPVAAGGEVEVFYRAPLVRGVPGGLGPVPQRTAGFTDVARGTLAVCTLVIAVLAGVVALLT